MNTAKRRIISLSTAILILVVTCFGALSAGAYWVGQSVGIGTVTSTSSRSLGTGLTYANTNIKDKSSNAQNIQTITFNPTTCNYVPIVYSQYCGYGATVINSAKNAESKYGYDVKGGVNASFFSMMSASANTYGGVTISNGKIIQGCNSNGGTWVMTFDSDGTSDLVYSRVIYALTVNGTTLWGALDGINMCPNSASATNETIYYYDTSCGTSTDTKTYGVEVVFNKINNTELTVGGTLTGQVAAIRNVSSGGSVGTNQFVLYAKDSSSYASTLRSLSVGSCVSIKVYESIEGSKTVMENCSSAFPTYGYNIVLNGQNVTANDGLGESFNTARAQRTGLGVKADGTIIMVASPGRTSTNPGLTVYQLADLLISQGCVTGINLDGGGSTQLVTESSGSLITNISSTRRVANSLLVIERPAVSSSLKSTLASKIATANNMLAGYELSSTAAINTALTYANSVYSTSTSMSGDYTKAIMRLDDAINGTTVIGYKTGIYNIATSSAIRSSASFSGTWLGQIPDGTTVSVTQTSGDWGYTKYANVSGWVYLPGYGTRISALATSGTTINTAAERAANQNFTASWNAVPGASGYTYAIVQLNGEPDPGNANESQNGVSLAYVTSSRNTSVTIPASSLTNGKYIKIAVGVEFPQGTIWTCKYIKGSELPFTDVATTAWYYESVKHVYNKGYFSGTSSTTFNPEGTMTRGMVAVVMYRMAGCPEVSGTLSFTDVSSSAYYYNGILWCNQNGIASGYNSTTFGPDDVITREQAAVFMYRLANKLGYDTTVNDPNSIYQFADADSVGSYAVTAMAWAVENGIMNGNSGNLMPKNGATRAQMATLLANFDRIFGR